jgi:hypothetical protein
VSGAIPVTRFIQEADCDREYWSYPLAFPGCIGWVYAPPGVGKSLFVMWFLMALCTGKAFIKWKVEKIVSAMLGDIEMGPVEIFPRVLRAGTFYQPDERFHLWYPTAEQAILPDIVTPAGQREWDKQIHASNAQVVAIDTFSAASGGLKDDDFGIKATKAAMPWLLKHRAEGRMMIVIDHTSKNGTLRGANAKQDIPNWVIKLSRPSDYEFTQGARFNLHFDKLRHGVGRDTEPLELWYTPDDEANPWKWRTLGGALEEQAMEMHQAKISPKEIASTLGLSRLKVMQLLRADKIDIAPSQSSERERAEIDRYFNEVV